MSEDSQEEGESSVNGNEGGSSSANFMLFLFFEFWFYLVIIVIWPDPVFDTGGPHSEVARASLVSQDTSSSSNVRLFTRSM